MTSSSPLPVYSNCVSWPKDKMAALEWLCENGVEINRADFLKRVSPSTMRNYERSLGYSPSGAKKRPEGMTMAEDWHVQYFRAPADEAVWFVHSAIEFVFAQSATIDAIDLRAAREADRAPHEDANDLLILVHPGSLYGSARMNVGRDAAEQAQIDIQETLINHGGPILVIDGSLSDEIPIQDDRIIEGALAAARARGHFAARVWGCDAGEAPGPQWLATRCHHDAGGPVIREEQCDAIAWLEEALGPQFSELRIGVTGAWASLGDDGCVNSVVEAARARGAQARILECALYIDAEPDEDLECADDLRASM